MLCETAEKYYIVLNFQGYIKKKIHLLSLSSFLNQSLLHQCPYLALTGFY